jgi:hypothetical protein
MEKLTEKINSFKICKNVKDGVLKVANDEEINIQQACRKLIKLGLHTYNLNMNWTGTFEQKSIT